MRADVTALRQLGQRFVSGVGWNVLGAVFNQGSTFVLGIIVANALGREKYGLFGFLQSTMLLFTSMGHLAMGFVATKFVAEYRTTQKERAGRVLVACLAFAAVSGALATLVAMGGARLIAERVTHRAGVESLIRIVAPGIFFLVITTACTGALIGFENFRRNALGGVISGIVYLALGAAMAQRGTVGGVLFGIVLSFVLQTAVMVSLVLSEARRQQVPVRWSSLRSLGAERSSLLHVAIPAALSGFSTVPALWLATSILVRQHNGIDQMALFAAAQAIRTVVVFLPYLINSVGFSVLSNHRGASDGAGFRHAFWMNMAAVVSVATAGAAVIILIGPYLLRTYGPTFTDAYPVLVILISSTIPETLALATYQVIQTRGHIWRSFFLVALPRDVSLVLLAIPLTRSYGAAGLATAHLCGSSIMLLSSVILVRRLGIAPHAVAQRQT
jgi:O-antigen/teichoic acid export membrane protein